MAEGFRSIEDIQAELTAFGVRSYALLVDDFPPQLILNAGPGLEFRGAYTFVFDVEGQPVAGSTVKLLPYEEPPDVDAWLVCGSSKGVYELIRHLHATGQSHRIVIPLATRGFASMFSYVDWLKGETNTVVHFQNVFERTYKIHFPIAVRWLVRTLEGAVVKASQTIVPPNHMVCFDAREMHELPDDFAGYLELYTEVRHLNGEVIPFLHMNCDYLSEDGIACIHQSGLRPFVPNTIFARGFIPDDPELEMVTSLFNKKNKEPVNLQAFMQCTLNGERVTVRRALPPLPHQTMAYVNMNEVFAAELAQGARQADIKVVADKEIHRPNYYLHRKGRRWSWTGVEHGAGISGSPLSEKRLADMKRLGTDPWICSFPILDRDFGIETSAIFFDEGPCRVHDFLARVHDGTGRLILEESLRFDHGEVINLQRWLEARGIEIDDGLINLAPAPSLQPVPDIFTILASFAHRSKPNLSPQITGSPPINIPVEINRSGMWQHPMVPTVHTEQFSKLVVSDEFDTVLSLFNAGSMRDFNRTAEIDIDIYTADGRMGRTSRVIPPNASLTLSGRELLAEMGLTSDRPYYSVWYYCRDLLLYGFHLLHRQRDHAIGVGHFYYGRFNSPDRV